MSGKIVVVTKQKKWITLEAGGRVVVSPQGRRGLIGLAVVYAVFLGLFETPLWQGDRVLPPSENLNVAEAEAWLTGSLELTEPQVDVAHFEGAMYNVFPPVMSFISAAVLPWSPNGIPYTLLGILVVLPLPGLAYFLFLKRCTSVSAAVLLACTFVIGTSAYPIMGRALQGGNVCRLNNAVSQVGIAIFLIDYYGARRFWLSGFGLLLCGWARWTMLAYLAPFLWGLQRSTAYSPIVSRWGGAAVVVVTLACPLILNAVKFNNPLDAGYSYIYEGRTDALAQAVHESGVFSVRFVPRNLYAMNLGLPSFETRNGKVRWIPDTGCTGLWWTTPLLLYVFVDTRRIWKDRRNRWLWLSVIVIFVALMMYHNDGWTQRGYNRFSLDFVLPLMAMIAPWVMEGRRRWLTVILCAWSVCYFRFLLY